ncbi:MAG: TolC family protein [Deltaproteobacteria bacterium]|nr:TolC family protein [Candidatus Zymogenaceae bacterium]
MKKYSILIYIVWVSFCVVFPRAVCAQEEKPTFTYTLDECLEIALKRSADIRIAAEEIKVASGVVLETWADILSVGANGGYTYTDFTAGSSRLSGGGSSYSESYTLGLSASIPVFTGGRTLWGINTSYLQKDLALEEFRSSVGSIIYETKTAFYSVLLAREETAMRTEELEVITRNVEITRNKFANGLVSQYELMRIEVELINTETSLIQAENSLSTALEDLKMLLAVDITQPIDIDGSFPVESRELTLEEYLLIAETESPELILAKLNENIAKKNLNMTVGEFFPTVSAFANYDYSNSDTFDVSFNKDDWEFTAGVMVEFPISEFLVATAKTKQAKAQYEQTKIAREEAERQIRLNVSTAYLDLTEAKKVIELQEKNIELARKNLEIAEIRYQNGIDTLLELLDAQLSLTDALVNYYTALYGYEEALARLEMIVGVDFVMYDVP